MSENEAFDFVLYRVFGLQGHVWWGTDYLAGLQNNMEKAQNIKNEIEVITLKDNGKYTSGLESLMILVSPNKAYTFIESGINFTMGYPAILNIMFNPISLFMVLVASGVFLVFLLICFTELSIHLI
ncbi:hypothetical protein IRB79_25910 [Cytobacillus oceanisediminis]|nr:DUF6418 domain-containing protein [Cytobacillus oceanisediminis]UOE55162.1 hypothetical protein IRB79_25910 [Cytobacillus oceanisediminis]